MVKQKTRKRKCDNKENIEATHSKRIDHGHVELEQKDWMPTAAVEFFNNKHFPKLVKEMVVVDQNMKMVGPFRKLMENSDVTGTNLIMLDREKTDLPEMQTFMLTTFGRYAFWRDTPSEKSPVIVFVDLKTVPELSMVGNTVEHAIHHFCGLFAKCQDNGKEAKAAASNILEILGDAKMKKETSRAIKKRQSISVGGLLGPGIYLEQHSNGSPRYRRLLHSRHDPHIENLLRCLTNAKVKSDEQAVIQLINDEIVGHVQICNDEGDFGNGLELGHVMFLANHKAIEDDLKMILIPAYKFLKRSDFIEILNLTLALR